MRLLYQPPQSIVEPEDAMRWIAKWSEAVLAECRDPGVLHRAWIEFKRMYANAFWPAPGMLCQTIRNMRREELRYQPERRDRLSEPDYHKPQLVDDATRNRTLAALAEADFMARSPVRAEALLGASLVKMGLGIIERNGQPRDAA